MSDHTLAVTSNPGDDPAHPFAYVLFSFRPLSRTTGRLIITAFRELADGSLELDKSAGRYGRISDLIDVTTDPDLSAWWATVEAAERAFAASKGITLASDWQPSVLIVNTGIGATKQMFCTAYFAQAKGSLFGDAGLIPAVSTSVSAFLFGAAAYNTRHSLV